MAYLRPLVGVPTEDMEDVRQGRPIKGSVVSAFLRLVERRSVYRGMADVWVIGPDLQSSWQRGEKSGAYMLASGGDILQKDLVLFPMLLSLGEWTLIAARPKEKCVQAFDPLLRPRDAEALLVREYLGSVAEVEGVPFHAEDWHTEGPPPNLHATPNRRSTGVVICAYADKLARRSSLQGYSVQPQSARRIIERALRRERFDEEDFSLLEGDSKGRFRFQGPRHSAARTVTFRVSGPGGPAEVSQQDDDLLREIDEAIGSLRLGSDLFSPPKRPRMEEGRHGGSPAKKHCVPHAPVTVGTASGGAPGGTETVEDEFEGIILTCSDIEDEAGTTRDSPKTPRAPVPVQNPRRAVSVSPRRRRGHAPVMSVTIASPSGRPNDAREWPRAVHASPNSRRFRRPNVPGRTRGERQGSRRTPAGTQTTRRDRARRVIPTTRGPVRPRTLSADDLSMVPEAFLRRLEYATEHMTPAERRNKRWRFFLRDGTFVRLRPGQIEWLLAHSRGPWF